MRVRLIRKFAPFIDGIDVSAHGVGDVIDMPAREARTLIAEGWAEPVEPSPRILVVEDEEAVRDYYRAGLTGRFVVDECADGVSALIYLSSRVPDVVILDLNLPRLHGQAFYKVVRSQPHTSGVPVVVVTGVDPIPEMPDATVLRKPCDIDQLIDALDRALAPPDPAS